MRFVKGFLRFWYDFVVGDDWKIATAVVVALGLGVLAALAGAAGSALFAPAVAAAVMVAFVVALLVDVRQ